MTWVTGAMFARGAVCLVLGYRVRSGKSRSFYPSYRTTVMWRNAPFAYIPWGIWLILGAMVASRAHSGVAVAVLAVIAFPTMIVAPVWLFKPPDVLKPRWLSRSRAAWFPSDGRRCSALRARAARAESTCHPSSTGVSGWQPP
jgi:hypothetical protein